MANQKKNILQKLNPNTSAKKLLAFVLAFSLLGGGYYAYRSFAYTPNTIHYAKDYAIPSGSKLSTDTIDKKKLDVVTLTGKDSKNRARMVISAPDTYTAGKYKVCFYYRITPNKKATVNVAFALYERGNQSKNIGYVGTTNTTISRYTSRCIDTTLSKNTKLDFVASVYNGSANYEKVTIYKHSNAIKPQANDIRVTGGNLMQYGTSAKDVSLFKQKGGNRDGSPVFEMRLPKTSIALNLESADIQDKMTILRGKQYEVCVDYAIGDKGSSSDLVMFLPVGVGKVQQVNLKTTKDINKYNTKCATFTYNGGNGNQVSLHYPKWAQSLANPYNIRVNIIKITQK